jgi:folate-binding protein YgfZ
MDTSFPCIGNVACITMEGADARRFAQAQFSGDVDALAPGHWQWNAWLTAQGRVRSVMHLVDAGDSRLLMVLRGGDAAAIRAGLARFRLRVRTSLAVQTFTAQAGGPVVAGTASIEPDGAVVLGYGERSLRLAGVAALPDATAQAAWRQQDIRQGWPVLPPAGEAEFLPPALGLEHLGAVAFDKGCYPGQEVAARLHYRGGHKYRLCHWQGSIAPTMGPVRTREGSTVAWVLDVAPFPEGVDVLAVTSLTATKNINILDNIFNNISVFDA